MLFLIGEGTLSSSAVAGVVAGISAAIILVVIIVFVVVMWRQKKVMSSLLNCHLSLHLSIPDFSRVPVSTVLQQLLPAAGAVVAVVMSVTTATLY